MQQFEWMEYILTFWHEKILQHILLMRRYRTVHTHQLVVFSMLSNWGSNCKPGKCPDLELNLQYFGCQLSHTGWQEKSWETFSFSLRMHPCNICQIKHIFKIRYKLSYTGPQLIRNFIEMLPFSHSRRDWKQPSYPLLSVYTETQSRRWHRTYSTIGSGRAMVNGSYLI